MGEEFSQIIGNKEVVDAIRSALVNHQVDDDLFEAIIVELLEEVVPDITAEVVDKIMLYYRLKVVAERLRQPSEGQGHSDPTIRTHESFNRKLRHLCYARHGSVFDLNISSPLGLSDLSANEVTEMLRGFTVTVAGETPAVVAVAKEQETPSVLGKSDEPAAIQFASKREILEMESVSGAPVEEKKDTAAQTVGNRSGGAACRSRGKYAVAALFQGLSAVKDYYRKHYGK